MKTLVSEQYAPITSMIGFLELPFQDAVEGLRGWREDLYETVRLDDVSSDGFPKAMSHLEPLTGGSRAREILFEAGPNWTAYFDCLLNGSDPDSAIGHLAVRLSCQGLAVTTIPHTYVPSRPTEGRMGACAFYLFGPLKTHAMNYVRSVSAIYDGSRWRFDADGMEQLFEEPEAYKARHVRDRFNSQMLERYCQALGVDVFNPEFYGPRAMLFESSVITGLDAPVASLAERQHQLGIVPGLADEVPG